MTMPSPRLIPTIDDPVQLDDSAKRCYGGRPAWTPRELQVIRERYPEGGSAACAPLLPARTPNAIVERARKLGVRHHREYVKAAPSNDLLDAAIRKLYARGKPPNGAMAEFAARWKRSRQWVRGRAIKLGCALSMGQDRRWTEAEEALLLDAIDLSPRAAQKRMAAELGIQDRTEPAIAERMRLLRRRHGLAREPARDPDLFSARELRLLMGVDHKAVSRWISRGLLEARAKRDQFGATVSWEIRRGPLREFLIRYPSEWHPGKCDRYWLVEILAGRVGAV